MSKEGINWLEMWKTKVANSEFGCLLQAPAKLEPLSPSSCHHDHLQDLGDQDVLCLEVKEMVRRTEGVDTVMNHHLQETSFTKDAYKEDIKDYLKSVKGNLKNRDQKE
ncbi:Translationally-Controlled Tumor Protein [Manis pentadactyla]|nr:Translationally-Controlled Tumor Protein [Manis pentadactyla]